MRLGLDTADPFNRLHERVGRRHVEAPGSDECPQKPLLLRHPLPGPLQNRGQLREMFLEIPGHLQQAALHVQQVAKVEHALLMLRQLRSQERQHRTPDNGGLEEGTGHEAHDGAAVRKPGVVVALGVRRERRVSMNHDRVEPGQVDVVPLGPSLRVGSDEHTGRA